MDCPILNYFEICRALFINWQVGNIVDIEEMCSRFCNCGRMQVILNGEPLEGVDCFKYLWSQVAADGGCERDEVHRLNEGYRA